MAWAPPGMFSAVALEFERVMVEYGDWMLDEMIERRDDPPTEGFLQLERNTEFDGANLGVFVTLDDGTVGSVNTTDDVLVPLPGVTPIPGHRAQAWTFLGLRESFGETGVSRPPPGVGG